MMDRKIITVVGLLSLLAISLAAYGQTGIPAATNDPKTEGVVDANGNLRVPADYRAVYQFLGSWAVAADQGQGNIGMRILSYRQRQARRGVDSVLPHTGRGPRSPR